MKHWREALALVAAVFVFGAALYGLGRAAGQQGPLDASLASWSSTCDNGNRVYVTGAGAVTVVEFDESCPKPMTTPEPEPTGEQEG